MFFNKLIGFFLTRLKNISGITYFTHFWPFKGIMQMSQCLNTWNQFYSKHSSICINFLYLISGIFSTIGSKIRFTLYFVSIFCIKHKHVHSQLCQYSNQEFHFFNCKHSISGTIQHQTVSFKINMLLILECFIFHMM